MKQKLVWALCAHVLFVGLTLRAQVISYFNWTASLSPFLSASISGNGLLLNGGYVYVLGFDPATIPAAALVRVQVSNQNKVALVFDNADGHHRNPTDMVSAATGKLYIVMGLFRLVIVEVDPIAMSYRTVVDTASYVNSGRGALATDGAFLYCAPEGTSKILRYDLGNFGAAPTELETYSNQDSIRLEGAQLFATTHDPSRLFRITVSPFAVDQMVILPFRYNSLGNHFAMTASHIWPTVDSNDPDVNGFIHKATKTNLSAIDAFRISNGAAPGHNATGTWEGEGYIWQTFSNQPGGNLHRINPADRSYVAFSWPSGIFTPNAMVFDGAGKAYVVSGVALSEIRVPNLGSSNTANPCPLGTMPRGNSGKCT